MITEFFMWLGGTIVQLVLSLLPDAGTAPNDTRDGFQQGIATVISYAGGFGHWIPWWVVPVCLALVIGSLFAGGAVRLVRMVVSHLTGGGGAS